MFRWSKILNADFECRARFVLHKRGRIENVKVSHLVIDKPLIYLLDFAFRLPDCQLAPVEKFGQNETRQT